MTYIAAQFHLCEKPTHGQSCVAISDQSHACKPRRDHQTAPRRTRAIGLVGSEHTKKKLLDAFGAEIIRFASWNGHRYLFASSPFRVTSLVAQRRRLPRPFLEAHQLKIPTESQFIAQLNHATGSSRHDWLCCAHYSQLIAHPMDPVRSPVRPALAPALHLGEPMRFLL